MDNVVHPNHYVKGGIECIQAIKASLSLEGFLGYCKGNVIKYLWRYEDKGHEEDLKKAEQYIRFMIDAIEEVPDAKR